MDARTDIRVPRWHTRSREMAEQPQRSNGKIMSKPLPAPPPKVKRDIRYWLDLPPSVAFPRCPAKSRSKIKMLAKSGEPDHADPKHFCEDCCCKYIAGQGTDHYGIGFCYHHEKGTRGQWCGEVAKRHHEVVRTGRNPAQYFDPKGYIEQMSEEVEKEKSNAELRTEIDLIRGHMQELLELASADGKKRDRCADAMDALAKALSDNTSVTDNHIIQLEDAVNRLESEVHAPLRGNDGRPISFEKKCDLIVKMTNAITRSAGTKVKIDQFDMVHWGDFKAYVLQVLTITQKHILKIADESSFAELLNEVQVVPEPTRGGGKRWRA